MTDELASYDYVLPEELIARRPPPSRDAARLMIVDRGADSVRHAFVRDLPDLLAAPAHLREAGIAPLDFDGRAATEPVVLAWMPAASLYFHDPDGNLLEFLAMLPDPPRPELGVVPWSEWSRTLNSPDTREH